MVSKKNEIQRFKEYLENNVLNVNKTAEFFDNIRYAEGYLPLNEDFKQFNKIFSRLVSTVQVLQDFKTNITHLKSQAKTEKQIQEIITEFYNLIESFEDRSIENNNQLTQLEKQINQVRETYIVETTSKT